MEKFLDMLASIIVCAVVLTGIVLSIGVLLFNGVPWWVIVVVPVIMWAFVRLANYE